MNTRLKQSLVVLGFVGFSLGLLWSMDIYPPTENVDTGIQMKLNEDNSKDAVDSIYQPQANLDLLNDGGTMLNTEVIRQNIDAALGLSVATISVSLAQPPVSERLIPWREGKQPLVKLSLPSTWLASRSTQLGGEEEVLDVLRSTILSIVPGSKIQFQIVQEPQFMQAVQPVTESYAKQIAIAVGLVAVLLSGYMIDRRRPEQETIVVRQVDHPAVEANRILQLEHSAAKKAINALSGSYKISVLQQIANTELALNEPPIVHIQRQNEGELSASS